MNPTFSNLPTSIFEVMSRLAREHQAVNLGQGFPDDPGPEDVRRKAAEAVVSGWNQYPPMMGLPELRQAVATHYAHHHAIGFDPDAEIMITSGATEAIAGALLALDRAGRRGGAVPADVRRLSAAGAPRRRRAEARAARSAALALR